jgi:hypothetical protein
VFTVIYEIIRKLNHMLLVGSFYGTQEELGTSCILNAFTGDAVGIARTAIDNAPTSDSTSYHLHSALRALLQAYLPSVFERSWTEAVRLYELGSVIAALTALDRPRGSCLRQGEP